MTGTSELDGTPETTESLTERFPRATKGPISVWHPQGPLVDSLFA